MDPAFCELRNRQYLQCISGFLILVYFLSFMFILFEYSRQMATTSNKNVIAIFHNELCVFQCISHFLIGRLIISKTSTLG